MNIINAAFVRNGATVRTLPVYQYNRGMILSISGIDLPATFRADFSNAEAGQSKTVIGTDSEVHIPYEYFVPGATIHCWLVWSGEDYTVTRKHIMIPIARRATPTDEEPTPDEQGVIDQAIAALNDAVTQTGQDADAAAGYAEQAEQSAQAAADAKDNAVAAQNAAETAKDQASQSSTSAAASAQNASESAQSASQSKTAAQEAAASVAGAMDTLEATIQADLQAAKESGMFDGADGVSPTVTITPITDGHQVMITDAEGEHTFDVTNGEPGADGFSPIATVTQTQTGATISITDKAGTTTAQISNGAKGDPGDDYVLTAQDKAEIAQQAAESIAPALDEKADAIHTAAGPAPIVSIPDAAASPVDALTVGIEPVQDLHGYDNPWPAGGGENILDPNLRFTAGTYYGGAVIATADGYNITLSGTPTESGNITTNNILTADAIVMPAGTYTSVGAIFSTYKADGSWYTNRQVGTWTADEPFIVRQAYIQAVAGTPISGRRFIALVKGSTAPTAWTPYSNICPITGWTGAKVTRTGKNLLDDSIKAVFGSRLLIGATSIYNNPTYLKAGTYSITVFGVNQTFAYLMKSQNALKTIVSGTNHGSFTVDNDGYYRIDFYGNDAISGNVTGVILVPGSAYATAYEPYQGSAYDITFPSEAGTVYGSSLNVKTGVLTVDRAMVDLGTLTWNKIATTGTHWRFWAYLNAMAYNGEMLSSQYKHITSSQQYLGEIGIASQSSGGNYLAMVSDERFSDAATFKTAMSGVQLVYELATPITYQLTPQEIRTLLGTNNIWADTGDVTVGYKADTKLYIDKKFAELQALILEH